MLRTDLPKYIKEMILKGRSIPYSTSNVNIAFEGKGKPCMRVEVDPIFLGEEDPIKCGTAVVESILNDEISGVLPEVIAEDKRLKGTPIHKTIILHDPVVFIDENDFLQCYEMVECRVDGKS